MSTATTSRRVTARAVLLAAMALAGFALPACGTVTSGGPGQGGPVVERYASNGKTVHVSVGDKIELILSSTYWDVRGSSAATVVRQDGPTVIKPAPAGQCVPGQGCGAVHTFFTARSAGTAVITASRTTCGEALACGPSQSHFTLTVKVG
jgi:hypothetical protein